MNSSLQSINYKIRPISEKEIPLLKNYLYIALFVPPGIKPFQKSLVDEPIFKPIYENWGKDGDIGFVATKITSEKVIGMSWVRLYDKVNLPFGIIDTIIPALSIAVDERYRNRGIGTALLNKLIDIVKNQGFKAISLSVDHRNYAVKLYKRFGFKLFQESEEYNPLYLLEF